MRPEGAVIPPGRTIDEVAISRDGRIGVFVPRIDKPDIEQGSSEHQIVIQIHPQEAERLMGLVVPSDWPGVFLSIRKRWNIPVVDALPVFAVLAVGQHLDSMGPLKLTDAGKRMTTSHIEGLFDEMVKARPAAYDEILAYLQAKVYWSWRFRHPETMITRADLIRLNSSIEDFAEVASLREGDLWTTTPKGGLKPTAQLIKEMEAQLATTAKDTDSRSLAVVVFADIADSSRLANKDEDLAVALIDAFEKACGEIIAERGGDIIKFTGDGVLAKFSNVPSAVRVSYDLLRRFSTTSRTFGKKTELRVGIHMGEVVQSQEGDIHGDVVNVAARLQAEATPGHVVISEDAWHQLKRRRGFACRDLGEYRLKGIEQPVRLYEVNALGNDDELVH
jgi:class 3 adenylate cyclase